MGRILKAAVVVAIVYLAFTKGLPWLKSKLDETMRLAGDSDQEICYNATAEAADEFTERLRRFSTPPIDIEAWDETVSASRAEIGEADRQCRNCDHEACLETARAITDLVGMVAAFDDSVQAGRGVPPDGAGRLDRIYEYLQRARSYM